MGKRSRKQRAPAKPAAAKPARPPSRSALRDAEARAALEPLAPGERPLAVVIGAAVTVIAATVNLVLYLGGRDIQGARPSAIGIAAFTALMYVMAWGLWNARYWAVLGLEGLLGILIVIVALLALRSSSIGDLLITFAILSPSGALFWFLIKAMARIQMPERPR